MDPNCIADIEFNILIICLIERIDLTIFEDQMGSHSKLQK